MKRILFAFGLFTLGLFLGVIATKISHKPVPEFLLYSFFAVFAAFVALLIFYLLQRFKK